MVLEGLFRAAPAPHTGERIHAMQVSLAPAIDTWPAAPYRCPRCMRFDTIPMPGDSLIDKLIGVLGLAPFKCRACRAKFYRAPIRRPGAVGPEAARNVAVCQKDPANTFRRLDEIIRVAESQRLRRG